MCWFIRLPQQYHNLVSLVDIVNNVKIVVTSVNIVKIASPSAYIVQFLVVFEEEKYLPAQAKYFEWFASASSPDDRPRALSSLLLTAITDNQDMIGLMLDIVLDITFQQGQQEPKQASNHWDEINMISDVLRMYTDLIFVKKFTQSDFWAKKFTH